MKKVFLLSILVCLPMAAIFAQLPNPPDNISTAPCFGAPPSFSWGMTSKYKSPSANHHTYAIPLVGDVNGDGLPEIITVNCESENINGVHPTKINILWGGPNQTITSLSVPEGITIEREYAKSICPYAMYKTTIGGNSYTYLVVKTGATGANLRAYNLNTQSQVWANTGGAGETYESPAVADFNNDGVPEVYVGNRIYNGNTGVLLVNGGSNNKGRTHGNYTVAANVMGDDNLELIAGNTVYQVHPSSFALTARTMFDDIRFNNNAQATDGNTVVADINGDGKLDVIYVATDTPGTFSGNRMLIAWDVETQRMLYKSAEISTGKGSGIPFVGNIDNDSGLEVVFMIKNKLLGYKPGSSKTFTLKYQTEVVDESGATGMTLFDFNNDGVAEIVYRDEDNLRIMKAHTNWNAFDNITTEKCGSTTALEYPVIADMDNDGAAEIIVIGHTERFSTPGYLWVFKSSTSNNWAPARKVWNQHAYNVVNVKEDLTIPPKQFNPAYKFSSGKQPFNNFLQQQTYLNLDGDPLWLLPQWGPVGEATTVYNPATDVLNITIKVQNSGSVPLNPPFMMTAYRNSVSSTSPKFTYSYQSTINAGATATITFGIPRFLKEWTPFNTIIVRLNNNGAGNGYGAIDQPQCTVSVNEVKDIKLIAVDDNATVFRNSNNNSIPVSLNDYKTCPSTGASKFTIKRVTGIGIAMHGSFSVSDTVLLYTPHPDFIGSDMLAYSITCVSDGIIHVDTATVYITVTLPPDNVEVASCVGTRPAGNWTFKLLAETPINWVDPSDSNTKGIVSSYGIPLVGDIDNDGKVEIVAPSTGIPSKANWGVGAQVYSFLTNKLRILNLEGSELVVKQTLETPYFNIIGNGYSIAKVDGANQPAAIFLCTSKRTPSGDDQTAGSRQQLIKYTLQGGIYQESLRTSYIKNSETSNYSKKEMAQPMIADFNGDGNPEVLVYGRIFNAQTLTELAYLDLFSGGRGSGQGAHTNNLIEGESSSIMAIADMDGDGLPEIVAGDCVYKVKITRLNGTLGNSITLWRQCAKFDYANNTHNEVKDGATAVADIDLDGYLDVIVSVPGPNKNENSGAVYVWNPRTCRVIHTNQITNLPTGKDIVATNTPGSGPSVAFVGDINNDGKPDICFTASEKMYSYYFTGTTLQKRWEANTNDESGSTSMAVFDFDQDGSNELVYRDEKNLRILKADGTDKIDPIAFASATQNEYPVIADIDGDGHAEILITGADNPLTWSSRLRVYSSNPAGKWAPARKVWNQFAYNAVNINEDLTVPENQVNPATVFSSGKRPFNGYLQQQTYLNAAGDPLWLLPNAEISSQSFAYSGTGDSLKITLTVTNSGEATLNAPFQITVYKNNVADVSKKYTYQHNTPLEKNESAVITFSIPKFDAEWTPFSLIIISINDDGISSTQTEQPECNNNDNKAPVNTLLLARNDVVRQILSYVTIKPLDNDQLGTCDVNTLTAFDTIKGKSPKNGTLIINRVTNSFLYTPKNNWNGVDSVDYYIKCGVDSSAARVYIYVSNIPDNMGNFQCYGSPPTPTTWGIQQASVSNAGNLAPMLPLVGDLTGDGIPEIVCWSLENGQTSGEAGLSQLRTILVYDGSNINEPIRKFTLSSDVTVNSPSTVDNGVTPVGLVQTHDGKRLIVVACRDLYLRAYDIVNGTSGNHYLLWTSDQQYGSSSNDMLSTIGFADFNQDGYPEIYIRDKVFDAESGILLATAAVGTNKASSYAQHNTLYPKMSAPVAADVIGDSKLELILGNEIYKVKIDSRTDPSLNSITRERTISFPSGAFNDGHTQVADFNGDGHLDILITVRHTYDANSTVSMYVWDVWNGKVGTPINLSVDAPGKSIPLVTDIDGDDNVEVLLQAKVNGTNTAFRLYECNPSTLEFTVDDWGYQPDGTSYSNSVTAFDFNHDGKMEIILTDLSVMNIYDGTAKVPLVTNTRPPVLASFNINQLLGMQYPVIADVDDDGQAEIVIIGYETSASNDSRLRIFKSANAESPWAPARKVWNQYMYHSVNINEDLTVPQYQFNSATKFSSGNQYFNNFLQQQTMRYENGTLRWLLPRPEIVSYSFVYNGIGDSLNVTLTVQNNGDASLNAPFKIMFSDEHLTTKHIYQHNTSIRKNETAVITFSIPKFYAKWSPVDGDLFMLVVNDDLDNTTYEQPYCTSDNGAWADYFLLAISDTVTTAMDRPISIKPLDNDQFDNCFPDPTAFDTIKGKSPKNGTLIINRATNSFTYTPNPSWYGIDSMDYYIKCDNDSSAARVYIAVVQPGSLMYFACQGVSVSMSMNYISNVPPPVTYHWYSTETGGGDVNPENPKTVIKNGDLTETFWVETRYKNIRFPRYKLELGLSAHCGTPPPSGCAVDGTLIWKEDFGGNDPNNHRVKPSGIDAYTDYEFVNDENYLHNASNSGKYALLKYNENQNNNKWHIRFSDHTHLGDLARGYMFITNAADDPTMSMYHNWIKNLCGGNLHVSLWALNLNNTSVSETLPPTFRIELLDSVDVVVATYSSNELPKTVNPTWYSYGFEFAVPGGYDSLRLRIYTNTADGSGVGIGNDFVFDDVEVRLCVPKVNITDPALDEKLVCAGSDVTLAGEYTDAIGSTNLTSKWLYSKTGNINNPDEWKEVANSTQTGIGSVMNNLTIVSATADTTGYYRLVVTDASSLNPNCRAMSRIIHLDVVKAFVPPDIRVYVKPEVGTVHLSSYIDSLPYAYTVSWLPSTDFSADQRGSLNVGGWRMPRTGVYKYTVASTACGTFTAKAYVYAINKYDKTETVYICKELPLSRVLNLNRILGVESVSGTWSYPNDNQGATASNVKTLPSGRHQDAKVFDAYKAFNDAGNHADYITGVPPDHKKFEIKYTSGTVTKTVRLIVY